MPKRGFGRVREIKTRAKHALVAALHLRFVVNHRARVARGRVVEASNAKKPNLDGCGYQLSLSIQQN
jgi:hypothetical protein